MLLQHVTELADLLGSEKFAVLQARKLAKYYARHLSTRAAFKAACQTSETIADLKRICQQYI